MINCDGRWSTVYHTERPPLVQHDGHNAARRAGLSVAAEACYAMQF